jgi:hypothetical protein
MVFGVKAWGEGSVWRGGRHRIEGVVVECFDDVSSLLFFKVEPLPYTFYFYLHTPNYALVALLPSASINGNFKLGSAYLLNESFGGIASPRYTVEFVSQYISIITYEVYVMTERVSLKHQNCVTHLRPYVLITQLFALAPVSSLV